MVMDRIIEELICYSAVELLLLLDIAIVVDYCCCCKQVQELATANAYGDMVHTAAAQIAYNITRCRTIQVELGKMEGFRETLKRCAGISSEC